MITDLKIHCFLWPKIKGDSFQFVQVPPTHITPHSTYIKSTLHFLVNISFKPCNILPDGSTHLWKGGGGRRRRQEKKKKSFSFTPPEYKMDQIPVLWYYISSMLLSATHYSLTETVNFMEAKAQNWIQSPKGLDTEK